jgi:hypothetical protein
LLRAFAKLVALTKSNVTRLNVPRELCRRKHRGPGTMIVQACCIFGGCFLFPL